MKNIKKTALGLIVGTIAIGGSAYKNSSTKYLGENFLVQISAYRFKAVWNAPNPDMCINNDTTNLNCYYNITWRGKLNIPNIYSWQTYSKDQILNWLAQSPYPYITNNSSSNKGIFYEGE